MASMAPVFCADATRRAPLALSASTSYSTGLRSQASSPGCRTAQSFQSYRLRIEAKSGTQIVRGGTTIRRSGGTIRVKGGPSTQSNGASWGGKRREEVEESSRGRFYFNVTGFPFPLSPFLERKTIRYEVDRGRIWTFEQEQGLGFSAVTTNIRMTVIKLQTGGLWVHAPIAPTTECMELLNELDAPVQHIVLPTFAYEHKVFVGPFARRFPAAQVWTAPFQWSWPLNLPPQLLGIFPSGELKDPGVPRDAALPSWAQEIPFKVLATPEVGIGPYVEVAFFHRATRTLLVTDCVILVSDQPPEVVAPSKLLAQAENGIQVQVLSKGVEVPEVEVEDTPFFRRLGWQRMVLLILYFAPSNLLDPAESFAQVAGRLTVSPVVKTLVFDKVPNQVLDWINSICSEWNFTRIIPCHFSAPIRASPYDLRKLFSSLLAEAAAGEGGTGEETERLPAPSLFEFLKAKLPFSSKATSFPEEDLKTLRSLDSTLVALGAVKKTGT